MKPRLVVVISHPIQYYAPLYAELTRRGNLDLHVVFLSDAGASPYHDSGFDRDMTWDIPLMDGYASSVLRPGLDLDGLGFWSISSPGLHGTLTRLAPDAILLSGYASRLNWQALGWARRHRCKVMYTGDSNAKVPTRRWRRWAKRVVVGAFFSRIDVFLCTSEAGLDYLVHFGARAEATWRMPFAIDVRRFSEKDGGAGAQRKYDFAWAGKLVPRKRPEDFVEALKLVSGVAGRKVRALLIGDGPMRDVISDMADCLPDACELDLRGFVNQLAMPQALQEAEIFAFTSIDEPYGLVATEAAAAGLALIVADGIGCVGDTVLARPGKNAIVYPPRDVQALASAMLALLGDGDRRRRMQQASLDIAREHDLPVAAGIIEAAVWNACGRNLTRATA